MTPQITGRSAAEIAASVRELIERGSLRPADALPSVRALADGLGVNRNTAVAAYKRFLKLAPEDQSAPAVKERIALLEERLAPAPEG